ncbi:hypothetical protein BH24ACI3_BH24ACI3_11790 [soil metagenome]
MTAPNQKTSALSTVKQNLIASSHRQYLCLAQTDIVDVDSLLRRFGRKREIAIHCFRDHVAAGVGNRYPEEIDSPAEVREEFADEKIHRMGEFDSRQAASRRRQAVGAFNAEAMVAAVESIFGLPRDSFCSKTKSAQAVMAKEILILSAHEAGATIAETAKIVDLDPSTTSRRRDAALLSLERDSKFKYAKELVDKKYHEKLRELHV